MQFFDFSTCFLIWSFKVFDISAKISTFYQKLRDHEWVYTHELLYGYFGHNFQHLHPFPPPFYSSLACYLVNFMLYYYERPVWLYFWLLSLSSIRSESSYSCIFTAISLNSSLIPVPSLALTSKLPEAPIDEAYYSLSYADTSYRCGKSILFPTTNVSILVPSSFCWNWFIWSDQRWALAKLSLSVMS